MQLNLRNVIQRRRIVIHHTHLLPNSWKSLLQPKDLVFFDDCLFSQWTFLTHNFKFFEENQIDCILGFSSGLYASEESPRQLEKVESYILHDACNANILTIDDADRLRTILPEMNGFMKLSQLKQLLKMPFCHLALHGCCHLNLSKEQNALKKIQLFKNDLNAGCKCLKKFGLSTNIFVYPYVHSFLMSDICLKKNGFKYIVGSNQIFRISIEKLYSEVSKTYNGIVSFQKKFSQIENK